MTAAGKRLIAAAKEARSQAELLAQIAILEKRVEEWRQDAAARLKTWMALAKSGLIGEPIQVRVSLIMPTYAMLNGDETGEFYEPTDDNGEPRPPYTSDVSEVLQETRKYLANRGHIRAVR